MQLLLGSSSGTRVVAMGTGHRIQRELPSTNLQNTSGALALAVYIVHHLLDPVASSIIQAHTGTLCFEAS